MSPETLATIDLIWSIVKPTAITVLTGVIVDLGLKARTWAATHIAGMNIANATADHAKMETEIQAAIGVGINASVDAIHRDGLTSKAVRDTVTAIASEYFQQHFPDRAAKIAASATSPVPAMPQTNLAAAQAVAETIGGRVGQVMAATLPPPTPPT